MSIEEKHIRVDRTARVYTYGRLSEQTRKIWLVAHGYGQLARYFIQHFEVLSANEHFVIAPEALSRAYIGGLSGRVGASWMTKEMRQEEISDYVQYLDAAIVSLVSSEQLTRIPVIALGFSQGAATISRWVHHTKINVSKMVLWGGEPGSELWNVNSFKNIPIILAIGTKDDYITVEKRKGLIDQCNAKGWSVTIQEYEGAHHLDKSLISLIGLTM